ncbi:MAG: hypothetical protein ACM34M_09370 [Ignavibacteria bacterium]
MEICFISQSVNDRMIEWLNDFIHPCILSAAKPATKHDCMFA